MKVRPVHDLTMHPTLIPISSIGGHIAALRYIIINAQVEGIPSYYEEQVAQVMLNMTQLGMKVPVILGTPMIHRLCRQMKESEIQTAPEEWQHALLSYKVSRNVSILPMTPQLDQDSNVKYPTNMGQDPTDLDEPVLLKHRVIIPAFASWIVHVGTQRTFMKGHRLNVMVQPPYPEDKAKLPLGPYVQRVYTKLKDGSRNVSTVLRNGTGKPMHLTARWLCWPHSGSKHGTGCGGFTGVGGETSQRRRVGDPVDYRATSGAPDEGVRRERQPWEVGWLEERDSPQGQAAPYGIPPHLESGKEWDWLYWHHRTCHWAAPRAGRALQREIQKDKCCTKWKRYGNTFRKCWMEVLYGPLSHPGVMP